MKQRCSDCVRWSRCAGELRQSEGRHTKKTCKVATIKAVEGTLESLKD